MVAIYAEADAEAVSEVAESVTVALERGASDLKLYEISIGKERLVKSYTEQVQWGV